MPANNIFQIRRGSSSQWNSSNPVLASGEPGYDITNNIYKIGDGVNNWNNLKSVLDINGNATISGILSASSGNFNNLLVSGIPVSVSGHAHVSADITDFNSSVSGLLPKIANSGDNRILTSTGSSLGIDAEINLTFSNDILSIVPTGIVGSVIHMYAVPNGQSAIHFISPSGSPFLDPLTRRLSIVYDEEDEQCRIVSHEDFTIQVFNRITLDSQTSGVFVNTAINNGLYVNDVQVSVSGHAHTSSNITDFNSSVSGLLPVIANSGDNRILTSTGSTVGVNAESNLTFDGNLLSVSGNLVAVSGTYNQLIFNTSLPDPDLSQGQLQWNSSEGTLDLGFTDTYSQHMGEELHYRVRNNTASTLTKGTAVYASGLTPGSNNRIEVAPFTADGSVREVRFMGLVTENISNGVNGYTTQFGYIRGIDTRGDAASNGYSGKLWDAGEPSWSEGDILYAHPTVAGKLTKVEPKHSISVAIILNRHQNQGKVFVRPTSYGHLNDNHDVSTSGATNGQFLQYNSSTDYWVPSSSGNFSTLSVNGSGVSLNGHTHSSSDITNFDSSVSGLLPTNLVTGVGANNYVARWNGTDSLISGIIFDNGTYIGIGTDNPQTNVQIVTGYTYDNINDLYVPTDSSLGGAAQVEIFQIIDGGYESNGSQKEYVNLGRFHCNASHSRGSFSLSNNGTNGAWEDNVMQFFVHGTNYAHGYYGGNLSDAGCAMIVTQGQDIVKLQIGNYNDAPIEFFTNNTQRLKINNNGDVGIGIDIPLYQLDVLGTGNFSQNLLINGTEVSISGHSHSTSDITDFNSSVSGLLPVINITAGSGISVSSISGNFTISTLENIINGSNLYLWANFR
jgi:hypothetical protein